MTMLGCSTEVPSSLEVVVLEGQVAIHPEARIQGKNMDRKDSKRRNERLTLSPVQRQRNSTGFRGHYRAEVVAASASKWSEDTSQLTNDGSERERHNEAATKKSPNSHVSVKSMLLDNYLQIHQGAKSEVFPTEAAVSLTAENEERKEDLTVEDAITETCGQLVTITGAHQQQDPSVRNVPSSQDSSNQSRPSLAPLRVMPGRTQSLGSAKTSMSRSLVVCPVDAEDEARKGEDPAATSGASSKPIRTDHQKLFAVRPQKPLKKAQSFRLPKRAGSRSLDVVFAGLTAKGNGSSNCHASQHSTVDNHNSFSSYTNVSHNERRDDGVDHSDGICKLTVGDAFRMGSIHSTSSMETATLASTEGLDVMMTLESIQRLSRHIPHAVVEDMIDQVMEIKKKREELREGGADPPVFPGMTLEVNLGEPGDDGGGNDDGGEAVGLLVRRNSADSLASMELLQHSSSPGATTPPFSMSARPIASSCRSLADDAASVMSAAANSIHAAMELSKNLDEQLENLMIHFDGNDENDDDDEDDDDASSASSSSSEGNEPDGENTTNSSPLCTDASESSARASHIQEEKPVHRGVVSALGESEFSCSKSSHVSESDGSNNAKNVMVPRHDNDDDSSLGSASTSGLLINDVRDEGENGSSDQTETDSSDESESCSCDSDDFADLADLSLPRRSFTSTASARSGGQVNRASLAVPSQLDPAGAQEVTKLRQGRLAVRLQQVADSALGGDHEEGSFESNSLENMTFGSANDKTYAADSVGTTVRSTHHKSAIAFVDISGFTKLSQALAVESLSRTINAYYDKIVSVIDAYGGDCIKFAGDAVLVEWREETASGGNSSSEQDLPEQDLPVALTAAVCASKLVELCSDYEVFANEQYITTLNLHAAVGFGDVVGVHLGDNDRMEYALLGDALRQMSAGMDAAALGAVAASPEVLKCISQHPELVEVHEPLEKRLHEMLEDNQPKVISSKEGGTLFSVKEGISFAAFQTGEERLEELIENRCHDWSLGDLETLQKKISRYLHAVVYADEFGADGDSFSAARRRSAGSSTGKRQHSEAELRDIFTVFLQPVLKEVDLTGERAGDQETLELLNNMLFIVNSEVAHFKAHLLSFMLDDKGLVIIVNFGLKGSTFPNMIHERAIPCVSNIRTLLRTELNLDSKMGATVGKAYAGVVGGSCRHQYSILGPSVNLAARLMCSKSNTGIIVDEEVKKRTGDRPYKGLLPVKAKGYNDLVNIYSPDVSVRKAWKDVGKEFVGREEDLRYLTDAAQNIRRDRKSKFTFVTAPYGMGKSCFLAQAVNVIENTCRFKGLRNLITRAVFCEDDSFKPFSVVRPLFVDLLRMKQHKASFGAVMSCIEGEAPTGMEETQLYVGLLKICLEAGIPLQYVEVLAGLIFTNRLSDIGTWSNRRSKMSEWNTIARYIVVAYLHGTREYDLVLLGLDDVSGMDEMSWKILHKIHDHARNMMVIGTARNEFDLNITSEYWNYLTEVGISSGAFRHLRLSWLNELEIKELACKRLDKSLSDLDAGMAQTVYYQSKGSPLIACEIIDMLYTINAGVDVAGSSGVQELLLNRLDSLPFLVRSYLNLGAIMGQSFNVRDVIAVLEIYDDVPVEQKEIHAASVVSSLNEAVENGILNGEEGSGIFWFSHALWRDTIAEHIMEELKKDFNLLILQVQGN